VPGYVSCPHCGRQYLYSPALLGRSYRCRQCSQLFPVTAPPAEVVAAPSTAAASQPPVPPPLPFRSPSGRHSQDDEPTDSDSDPRPRRLADANRPTSTAALIGLVLACFAGFFVLLGGVIYMLWPTSTKTTAVTQGPSPPEPPPVAVDPPKKLDDILKEAPVNDAGRRLPGRPGVANPLPPGLPPRPGPGFRPGAGMGLHPASFPAAPPVPEPGEGGPQFARIERAKIGPARLERDHSEIGLPGPVETAVAAAGGRYLLLHVPKVKKVLFFDVSDAKVVREIDAPDPNTMLAGGMNTFILYSPAENRVERWSFKAMEREPDVPSPFKDPVKALAMGCASNGPLVAALGGSRKTRGHAGATLAYYNPTTLKEVSYTIGGKPNDFGLGVRDTRAAIRVSADGRVVTGWGLDRPSGVECHVITNGRVTRDWMMEKPVPMVPSPDGRFLYGRDQVFLNDLRGRQDVIHNPFVVYLPAVQGNWYLAAAGGRGLPPGMGGEPAVGIYRAGQFRPAVTIESAEDVDLSLADRGLDQSLFLIPDAQVLVSIAAPKRSKLVLRRVELK
jgi:hypothetical protein